MDEDLIANLLKVKLPFEPGAMAEAAGIGALQDKEFLHRTLEVNARGMRTISQGLRALGVQVILSDANFVMTVWEDAEEALRVTDGLLREGVIVRPLTAFGIPNAVRISTGTEPENLQFLDAMEKVMTPAKV